jgi:lysyl hydroxylase/galactosyltransferase/glucosyltransferase
MGKRIMKVLIYSTDLNHGNIRHLTSSLGAEILPIILPWTMDFYPKSYSVTQYISEMDPENLILVCDAYDVLCLNNCSLDKLEEKIRFDFDLDKITFNAETNCFPDWRLAKDYPVVDSKWKYLNGGIYVGKVKNIMFMMDQVLPKIKGSDEQLEFSKFFISNQHLLALDYECKIFQTLYNGSVGGDIDMSDFLIQDNLVYNKHFNTLPLLFHGNGKVNMTNLVQYS